MNYLIDTDTLIYHLKGHNKVKSNFIAKKNSPKYISVISYGELIFGARKSKHIESNLARVHRIAEIFPVIKISTSIMDTFGELKANLQKNGNIIDDFDLLIASTALVNNLTVVTNNEKHFKKIDNLEIENWTK